MVAPAGTAIVRRGLGDTGGSRSPRVVVLVVLTVAFRLAGHHSNG
ncbi:hypothetical protein [Amycolatopsis endophytica]